MINKVWQYVQKNHMFEENDYVVAGVSGGADSVCLLCMLLEIKKRIPMTIHVVHINHKMRQEAGEDAAYVEGLCKKYHLPYTLVEKEVEELAKREHLSTEEAGRKVRYEAFYQVLATYGDGKNGKIAIAHNQNDCSETFLFHLFRGSGLQGLTGIKPVRDNVVRPILCLNRSEIEDYLKKKQIAYCIDKTNFEDNYTRNKIRHHILPYVEEEISKNATRHIAEACERLQEANTLITELTDEFYDSCVTVIKEQYHIHDFEKVSKTLQPYVLQRVLEKLCGSKKDIGSVHVKDLQALFEKQCGRVLDLPYGVEAKREYDGICLYQKKETPEEFFYMFSKEDIEKMEKGESICITLSDREELFCKIFPAEQEIIEKNIPTNPYTKWLDYDKIKDNIVVRNRKAGDYFTINEKGQHKSLKSFFVDEKVPKDLRDRMYLVTEKSHVLWIVGSRISSYYKVGKDTKYIIEWKYRGGVENG